MGRRRSRCTGCGRPRVFRSEDGGVLTQDLRLSPGGETTTGASPGPAGPLWGEEDLAARAVDGHGSAGSEVGPLAGPPPTRRSQSAFRQAPASRTSLPVYLPV